MKILEFAQGTPEWVDAKLGLASASNFKRIMTPATMQPSTQALDYACELIAERMTGGKDPWKWQGETADMQRGTYTEAEARKWFQLERDVDVEQVGLVIHGNDRWCCSPDGLIGDLEGLELKCPAPKTQVRWLADGIVPVEHLPQVHGALIVTGRERWWFMSYCLGLPPLLRVVKRDAYTEALQTHLEAFNKTYDELWQKIQDRLQSHIDAEIERRQDAAPAKLRSFINDVA